MWYEDSEDTPDDSEAVWFDEGALDGKLLASLLNQGLCAFFVLSGMLFSQVCLVPYFIHFLEKSLLTFLSNVALSHLLHSLSSYSRFLC